MKPYLPLALVLTSCVTTSEITKDTLTTDSTEYISVSKHDSIIMSNAAYYSSEIERIKSEAVTVTGEPNDTCDTPPKLYRISIGGDSVLVYGVVKSYEWKKKPSQSVSQKSSSVVSSDKETYSDRTIYSERGVSSIGSYSTQKTIIIEPTFIQVIFKYWWLPIVFFFLGVYAAFRFR